MTGMFVKFFGNGQLDIISSTLDGMFSSDLIEILEEIKSSLSRFFNIFSIDLIWKLWYSAYIKQQFILSRLMFLFSMYEPI